MTHVTCGYELYCGCLLPWGELETTEEITEAINYNGKEYTRTEKHPVTLCFDCAEEDDTMKERWLSFAPYGSVWAKYDERIPLVLDFLSLERHQMSNYVAGLYSMASREFNLEVMHQNLHKHRKGKMHSTKFEHVIYSWGYGNCLTIDYRFDDLLVMDVSDIKDKEDLARLEGECAHNDILKDCLNFEVFKRPLTDLEKLQCATKFLKNYDPRKH